MIISVLLAVISPYTAFLPAIYVTYLVFSKKFAMQKNPWNIGLLLLFIWSFISGVVNKDLVSTVLSIAFFIYLGLSIYLENNFFNEDKIEKLCKYLVYFSIFTVAFGIIEKITFMYFDSTLWQVLLGITDQPIAKHRIYSTFGNPNVAGTWFAAMVLICMYFINRTTEKTKLFYQVCGFVFLFALCLAGSSGAFIGLLLALFVYFLLMKSYKGICYLGAFVLFIGLTTLIPPQIINIRGMILHEFNYSFYSRYAEWVGCLKMLKLKPVTGWGLMGIYNHGLAYINYHARVFHGHNIWITIATTLGIVGLAIFVSMKFYLYSSLRTLYKQNCRLVPLLAAIQALVVGHGLVDFTIMTPQAGLLFISCSAFISSLAAQYKTSAVHSPAPVKQIKSLSKVS